MRIACIAASSVPSLTANSIQVMKVCQALVQLGHCVQVWLPGRTPKTPWSDLADHYGLSVEVPIEWMPSAGLLRRYDFGLQAVLAAWRWKPDLYYVWLYQAAALASTLGLPTLLEMHDRPSGALGPWLFRMFLWGRGARRTLCTTEALRAWLEAACGTRLQPPFTQVAPNGVSIESYRDLPQPAEARRRLGLPDRFTASYTGHLYEGRGVGLMIELAVRHPEISFVLAGGEPEAAAAWRGRLEAAGAKNVTMLGFLPNIRLPLLHAASDVLLMPYARSIAVSSGGDTSAFASPMKAFEYLAAGRVILSSDLPVFREILNARNAVLLPPEDIDAWDRALGELARNPARRASLSERAKRDASAFSWRRRARRAIEDLGD